MYHIPIVNLFYDMLFDSAPTMAQLNSLLQVFGLLNGLLIGVSAAVMNIFQFEDVQVLVANLAAVDCTNMYDEYKSNAELAFVLLTSALLMLVMVFMFTANISFDVHGAADVEHKATQEAWWSVARYLMMLILVATAAGMSFVKMAVDNAFIIQHALTEDTCDKDQSRIFIYNMVFLTGCGVILPMVTLSLALSRKERAAEKQRRELTAKVDPSNSESETVEPTAA
jgi:hypothetical protein